MTHRKPVLGLLALTAVSIAIGVFVGANFDSDTFAAGGMLADVTGVAPDRYVYYPGTEEGLEPDKSRKPEIVWPELINQRLDMTDVNKRWLDEYKKEHGLK